MSPQAMALRDDDDLDDDLEPEPDPEPAPKATPKKKAGASRAPTTGLRTPTAAQMRDEEVADIRDRYRTMGIDGSVRVAIHRTHPQPGPNGEGVGGWCETVHELIDEEYLNTDWGGGTFQLKISAPDGNGTFKYVKA